MAMQLNRGLAFVALAFAAFPVNSLRFNGRGSSKLQPQLVAHTLFQMENEWRSQAKLFAECNATRGGDCSAARNAFHKSCLKVVSAVEQASSGDRSVVKEYMGDVCGQASLEGWRKERCQSLAATITGVMSADNYENRESLDVAGVCQSYWSSFAVEEAALVTKELAEAEAKRVARVAEEKKLAEERAEAAKKAAEKAAKLEKQRKAEEAARQEADAKRKAAEEKQKAEDAKRKAAEEKQKAEKEAAELKTKEEAALRKAEEAKHRMEEAKAAAEQVRQKRAASAPLVKVNTTHAATVPVAQKPASSTVSKPATKAVQETHPKTKDVPKAAAK